MDSRKTVLITGCSSGIGHALAREFSSKGLRVFATARQSSSLSDLEQNGIETFSLEVTNAESISNLKKEISSRTNGKLDMLVNNAGRNYTVPALDIDFDEVQSTFEVNVIAVMRMCKEFSPLLIESKGTIVQLGSLAGLMPYVFGSVYNASKAALHAYSDTLRVELAPFGVKVVTVVTGGVKSNIARVDRVLPEDSIYLPINSDYLRRTKHSQEVGMVTEEYAKSVVSQLLHSPQKKVIWEGSKSWLVWFASSFLPKSVLEFYMSRTFSLWKLTSPEATKKLA
ncbi:hypothetical protein AAFC00_001317 [Neodothiora populina]|uniref:NAD(P)-binding protein n=1 Tax=Neodothiora populina TaxID=2781224 RepID=A0ABR3PNJ7_9PEZI